MARLVNRNPALSLTPRSSSPQDLLLFDQTYSRFVFQELLEHAQRLNGMLPKDGTEAMTGPLVLSEYLKAALPVAASWQGGLIAVSNETGGYTLAFSDGTNWRRVQDRNVVS